MLAARLPCLCSRSSPCINGVVPLTLNSSSGGETLVHAEGKGWLSGACTSAGGTYLSWTERRIKRSTLRCGEAETSTKEQVRAVAIQRRVECVEIRQGQIASRGDNRVAVVALFDGIRVATSR